jgi:hypothetical protein
VSPNGGQARFCFGDDTSNVTDAMRSELATLFGRVFAAIAGRHGRACPAAPPLQSFGPVALTRRRDARAQHVVGVAR